MRRGESAGTVPPHPFYRAALYKIPTYRISETYDKEGDIKIISKRAGHSIYAVEKRRAMSIYFTLDRDREKRKSIRWRERINKILLEHKKGPLELLE